MPTVMAGSERSALIFGPRGTVNDARRRGGTLGLCPRGAGTVRAPALSFRRGARHFSGIFPWTERRFRDERCEAEPATAGRPRRFHSHRTAHRGGHHQHRGRPRRAALLTAGDAGSDVRVSAIRPAVVVLCLALLGAAASPWTHDWLLTVQARQLAERFGSSDEADAVLRVWRSPAHLRQRVHDLVRADEALLERAVRSNWPFAHAGLEPPRVREAAAAVCARLEREKDPAMAGKLAWGYAAVVARLNDAADVKAAAASLRARLERERDPGVAGALASAYAAVAGRLTDGADLKAEAAAVRARLEREQDPGVAGRLGLTYAAVAGRLTDAADVKAAAATLWARLEREQNPGIAGGLALAYAAVAKRLNDAADVKAAVATLRAWLERERDPWMPGGLAGAYAAVVGRLTDAADVKAEAATLRARLEREQDPGIAGRLGLTYAAVAERLTDAADVKAAAATLRARLEQEREPGTARKL